VTTLDAPDEINCPRQVELRRRRQSGTTPETWTCSPRCARRGPGATSWATSCATSTPATCRCRRASSSVLSLANHICTPAATVPNSVATLQSHPLCRVMQCHTMFSRANIKCRCGLATHDCLCLRHVSIIPRSSLANCYPGASLRVVAPVTFVQDAAAWLLDGDLRADGGFSIEAAEEAWRQASAADERAEAERQAELRAVKQQLCDKCACMLKSFII